MFYWPYTILWNLHSVKSSASSKWERAGISRFY